MHTFIATIVYSRGHVWRLTVDARSIDSARCDALDFVESSAMLAAGEEFQSLTVEAQS